MTTTHQGHGTRHHHDRRRGPPTPATAAAAAAMLLLAGACTGTDADQSAPTSTPPPTATTTPQAPSPTLTPSPTPSPTPRIDPATIDFTYQAPDPVCVPVDELSLPGADQHNYHTDPSLNESNKIRIGCVYELDHIAEEDHVRVYIRTSLYPHRNDSPMAKVFPDIPIDSDDLNEWANTGTGGRNYEPWSEGCPAEPTCGNDKAPTSDTVAREGWFSGMVGNLEIDARITYISSDLPDDVVRTNLTIFRTYILAELQRRDYTINKQKDA